MFNKYRRFVFLIADTCCLVFSSVFVWFFLELIQSFVNDITVKELCLHTAFYVLFTIISLFAAGAYKPVWRYATMRDLVSCFSGTVIGIFFSYITMIAFSYIGIVNKRFSLVYCVFNL